MGYSCRLGLTVSCLDTKEVHSFFVVPGEGFEPRSSPIEVGGHWPIDRPRLKVMWPRFDMEIPHSSFRNYRWCCSIDLTASSSKRWKKREGKVMRFSKDWSQKSKCLLYDHSKLGWETDFFYFFFLVQVSHDTAWLSTSLLPILYVRLTSALFNPKCYQSCKYTVYCI